MCAGIPACNPTTLLQFSMLVEERERRASEAQGHVSVTPVTQTLWVFKGLPGDSRPSLRLLLITPD